MSSVSYLRVSTSGQTVENQRRAIAAAGWVIDKEFADSAVSGTTMADARPGWAACSAYLREGDTLVVFALDRIGRSTVDVLQTIDSLSSRGIDLVILQQGFDTRGAAGRLALTVLSAFCAYETELRKERQKEGIARARASGKYAGRKPKLSVEQQAELSKRFQAGECRSELARQFGIDRVTVHRYAKQGSESNSAGKKRK